jgi:hypothetical protein
MKRLGVTGAQELTKLGITETGQTKRANIAVKPGIMQQTRANLPVPGTSKILKGSGLIGSEEDPLDAWSKNWIRLGG